MAMVNHRTSLVGLAVLVVGMSLCGGCNSDYKYAETFGAGVVGGLIGALVGHDSEEEQAGAAVGAAVFAVGDALHQIDELNEKKVEKAAEEVAKGDYLLNPAWQEQ